MKKSLIIANWKMGLLFQESVFLAQEFGKALSAHMSTKEIVLCPCFTSLASIRALKIGLKLGGQNVFWEERGKLTGEVSPQDLIALGCQYCIVGHSSRRQYLGESDEMVCKKTQACLKVGLVPVVCIGETWEEKTNGKRDIRLIEQIHAIFKNCSILKDQHVAIAYEPIWAIGTGKSIDPDDAFLAADLVRHTLRDFFSQAIIDEQFHILYGGSVSGKTVASFFSHPSIEGVLVGSDSLSLDSFQSIVENI